MLFRGIFCPCPTGFTNPDSFRFSEAIEAKGDGYWKGFFNSSGTQIPDELFITNNWNETQLLVESLLRDPPFLDYKWKTLLKWYEKYKNSLQKRIESILDGFCDEWV